MSKVGFGITKAYRGETDTWLTPPHIIKAVGEFDLDPATPIDMPWRTATIMYNVNDDGYSKEWCGRVFMNPPYGPETKRWIAKLAAHGNGIALIFARTETAYFQEHVWGKADSILFMRNRIRFYDITGKESTNNAGAPSVLVAYGANNTTALENSGIPGALVYLKGNVRINNG